MRRAIRTIAARSSLAMAALCVPALASAADASAAARGKAVFMAKGCFECHGRVGQGSTLTAPALVPLALSAEGLRAYVRAPTGVMPPYSAKLLSDEEAGDIAAYLGALPRPRPPQDYPLLAPYVPAAPGSPGR